MNIDIITLIIAKNYTPNKLILSKKMEYSTQKFLHFIPIDEKIYLFELKNICKHNNDYAVFLLKYMDDDHIDELFFYSAKQPNPFLAELIISQNRTIRLSKTIFKFAKYPHIVKLLLDKKLLPTSYKDNFLVKSCGYGCVKTIKYLLLEPDVSPSCHNNLPISQAVRYQYGALHNITLLITDPRFAIDIYAAQNILSHICVNYETTTIFSILLKSDHFKINNNILISCCKDREINATTYSFIKLIIQYIDKISPDAFIELCKKGVYNEIIELLLKDENFIFDNDDARTAIGFAHTMGNIELVKILMADKRIVNSLTYSEFAVYNRLIAKNDTSCIIM